HCRRADIGEVAITVVQGAAVEGADLGPQLLDMLQPFERTNQIRALARLQRIRVADNVVATHAGAEIDDYVDAAATDSLDHLAIPVRMTAALASLGIAYVNVGHGGAGVGRFDDRLRNLLRRNRNRRMPAHGIPRPCHRTGDDDLGVHRLTTLHQDFDAFSPPFSSTRSRCLSRTVRLKSTPPVSIIPLLRRRVTSNPTRSTDKPCS